MFISLIVLSLGIAGWVAGAYYERNKPAWDGTKGLAALPGCVLAIAGFIAVLWNLLWWIGAAVLLVVLYFAYRLILPDKYQWRW
jgi:hypothetical protein